MRPTLVALIVSATLPLLLLGAVVSTLELRERMRVEREANLEVARAAALSLDGFVQHVLREEAAIVKAVGSDTPGAAELRRQFAITLAGFPTLRSMSWVGPHGRIHWSSRPELEGRDVGELTFIREIRAGAPWAISDRYPSIRDELPVFAIARAVRGADGSLTGIVYATVDPKGLGDSVLSFARTGGATVALLDRRGAMVYRHPLPLVGGQLPLADPLVRRALAGAEASGDLPASGPEPATIAALVPVGTLGWVTQASRPRAEVLGPVVRRYSLHLGLALVVAGMALAAAIALARRISTPVALLGGRARAIAGGRDSPVPIRGVAELEELATGFDAMAWRLAAREAELRRSEGVTEQARLAAEAALAESRRHAARLDAVITAVPDGLMISDERGGIVRINDLARSSFQATPEELKLPLAERRGLVSITLADGTELPEPGSPTLRALRGEIVRGLVLRLERRDPDAGPARWFSTSAAPIRGPGGEVAGAVTTLTDITELHDLQERHADLLRAISHDLRSPLSVVVAQAQLLERRPEGAMAQRAASIRVAARRMDVMIEELVDFASLDAGRLELRLEPVDLAGFVRALIERLAGTLDTERLHLEAPGGVPRALADPDRLERIVVNLLSNAFKYSAPGSPIRVEILAGAHGPALVVRDAGPGIDPTELPRLFQRFFRGRRDRQVGGIGLGLYVTRALVEAHGGRISVESRPGEGSAFRVELPAAGEGEPEALLH